MHAKDKKKNTPWADIITELRKAVHPTTLPSVSAVAAKNSSPFEILIATMISLRTKDAVTMEAAGRLLNIAPTPQKLADLTVDEIARAIYPAGFYKIKATNIQKTARTISTHYHGQVPSTQAELLKLPGVGIKTANLTLNLGFGIDAICVDTHVHRMSNRFGWVDTQSPEKTEKALEKILPKKYWIEINELLVRYGQSICTPISPYCSRCSLIVWCSQKGVIKKR